LRIVAAVTEHFVVNGHVAVGVVYVTQTQHNSADNWGFIPTAVSLYRQTCRVASRPDVSGRSDSVVRTRNRLQTKLVAVILDACSHAVCPCITLLQTHAETSTQRGRFTDRL